MDQELTSTKTNDTKHKFDLLYGSLCEFQHGLLNNTAKVSGFLLLAIGWLVTSKDTRAIFQNDELLSLLTVLALIGGFLFYVLAAYKVSRDAKRILELLKELDHLPSEYYSHRGIDWKAFAIFISANLILVSLLASLILS